MAHVGNGGELSDRGFVVRSFADAASLLDGLDIATGADIIVLDRGLPDVSGIDLLAQLRQSGMSLPVVFLLATLLAPGNASRSIEAPSTSSARLVAWRFWSSVRHLLETAKSAASPASANPMICSSLIPI